LVRDFQTSQTTIQIKQKKKKLNRKDKDKIGKKLILSIVRVLGLIYSEISLTTSTTFPLKLADRYPTRPTCLQEIQN